MNDNRDPVVDAWFDKYENPQKDLVQAVRQIILDADPRVTEAIKRRSPTFCIEEISLRAIRRRQLMCR